MSESTHNQKLRIAIVGGGIGGLTLAVAFSQLNLDEYIQVDVYESTAKLTQAGAGITLWPRGWEILRNLGLEASLQALLPPDQKRRPGAQEPESSSLVKKSDQKEGILVSDVLIPGGSTSFHRADIQNVLLDHISPGINIHLSHRLTIHRETEYAVELEFKNGETAICDILVGADGINSVIRSVLLANGKDWSEEERARNARPVWTGTVVYRSLIDSELIRKDYPNHNGLVSPMVYCGKNKHLIAYPVSQGGLVNAVQFFTDPEKEGTYFDGPVVVEKTTDNLEHHFAGWEEEAQVLVRNMVNPSRWAIQTVKPLDTYVSSRVLLIGDAAHAMPPHLGNGAGQAMEDAYIISNLIAKAVRLGGVDIQKLVKVYDAIRQPFGNFAAASSRNQGLLYELSAPGFEDIKDGEDMSVEKIAELGRAIEKGWEWTYQSPMDDLERALAML